MMSKEGNKKVYEIVKKAEKKGKNISEIFKIAKKKLKDLAKNPKYEEATSSRVLNTVKESIPLPMFTSV